MSTSTETPEPTDDHEEDASESHPTTQLQEGVTAAEINLPPTNAADNRRKFGV